MDAEVYPQEVLADEEPKYLRRQKPVEIKRRKFGKQAWKTYLRVTMWTAVGIVGVAAAYECGDFLLTSSKMKLIHRDQISLVRPEQIHFVSLATVQQVFAPDRNKSVLRIPIDERRHQLESIPWVEQAVVRRALPNQIQVEIIERTPIAFLRDGSRLALIDAHGVILERPVAGDFHFPVVTGISSETSIDEREQRMQLFSKFLQEIGTVKENAADQVSEVDVAAEQDLRATITGLGNFVGDATDGASSGVPVLVHFGNDDFAGKYETLMDQFGVWRAKAGRIESVDLRYSREAVVNQDTTAFAQSRPPAKPAQGKGH